jgi:hypothetical protein
MYCSCRRSCICTSHVEGLACRVRISPYVHIRRRTRLRMPSAKTSENYKVAVALHFALGADVALLGKPKLSKRLSRSFATGIT